MTLPEIYYYDFSQSDRILSDLREFLSDERYEYCSGMKSDTSALRSAYGFMLLRYALKKEYGITEMPVFAMNEYGKPFLSGHTDIWFNISHSQKSVVCAVADRPVGVDIQDIRPLNMRVGEKFMTKTEEAAVKSITDPDELNRELCRLWCIKESYGKMTGKGFGEGFKKVETDRLIAENRVSVTERGGFFISVCI